MIFPCFSCFFQEKENQGKIVLDNNGPYCIFHGPPVLHTYTLLAGIAPTMAASLLFFRTHAPPRWYFSRCRMLFRQACSWSGLLRRSRCVCGAWWRYPSYPALLSNPRPELCGLRFGTGCVLVGSTGVVVARRVWLRDKICRHSCGCVR